MKYYKLLCPHCKGITIHCEAKDGDPAYCMRHEKREIKREMIRELILKDSSLQTLANAYRDRN